jgi:hypothetical protein
VWRFLCGGYEPIKGRGKVYTDELLLLIEFVQPFCDALHLLEGDRPFLPQVIPIWESLEQHVDAFVAKYPDEKFKSLPEMFKRRRDNHCPDAAYAAVAFDPASFTKDEASGNWQAAIMTMDSDEVSRVEKYCERFVAPDEIEALREELAMLQLEPLPKQFDNLYKVCSRRTETARAPRSSSRPAAAAAGCGRATWPRRRAKKTGCSLCAPTACCPCTRPAQRPSATGRCGGRSTPSTRRQRDHGGRQRDLGDLPNLDTIVGVSEGRGVVDEWLFCMT